jgi:hypothetical protein
MATAPKGWRFPTNDDGEDDQLNQPGIEDFRNTPIISLAREICQNSLDAKDPSQHAPVEVHFNIIELPVEEFPGIQEFRSILASCKSGQPDSEKTQTFFNRAIAIANAEKISCLTISDFNTTGLKGVSSGKNTDWYKLTKAVGSSDKSSSLGSFGIGKFAPYANSDLRTVFYSTLNANEERAFQGVSRLISHEWEGVNTRGTGYFGVRAKNEPILEATAIPEFARREKIGTSIIVAGFQRDPKWELKIIRAVLESFFCAIQSETLVVRAGKSRVNKGNLAGWVEKMANPSDDVLRGSLVPYYYESLVSSDAREFVEQNFRGKGRISLRLVSGRNHPKRVAIVRGSGMKIFDKGNFQTAMKFAGVFNAEGAGVNDYLKSMEPQQHDKLVASRADDPVEAQKFLDYLYRWLNDCVRSVADDQASDEADIEGVSKFLPDDVDDVIARDESDEVVEPTEAASEIPLIFKGRESSPKRVNILAIDALPTDEMVPHEIPENPGTDPTQPNPEPSTPNDAVPLGVEQGTGGAMPSQGQSSTSQGVSVGLTQQRSFGADRDNKKLIVYFCPEMSCAGRVSLIALGETIQAKVPAKSARLVSGDMALSITSDGSIGPIDLVAGQRYSIEVSLKKPSRFALGVVLHAD